MEKEYRVTFVFTETVVTRPVITHHTDENAIADLAIAEVFEETGMNVSGASWQVDW